MADEKKEPYFERAKFKLQDFINCSPMRKAKMFDTFGTYDVAAVADRSAFKPDIIETICRAVGGTADDLNEINK